MNSFPPCDCFWPIMELKRMILKRARFFFYSWNPIKLPSIRRGRRKNVGQSGFSRATFHRSRFLLRFRYTRLFSKRAANSHCLSNIAAASKNIGPFGYWLVTECVYRRWRMKSAGIGETVRKRVLLTDPLSRQRVFKRLQFFMFKNMIWKCETIVKLFVYTKMYI